jgi:hypothetical protein
MEVEKTSPVANHQVHIPPSATLLQRLTFLQIAMAAWTRRMRAFVTNLQRRRKRKLSRTYRARLP